MNERILELWEKAQICVIDADCSDYHERLQLKFAELIVRQCAMKADAVAIDLRNDPDLDPRKYVGDSILKTFGVEE